MHFHNTLQIERVFYISLTNNSYKESCLRQNLALRALLLSQEGHFNEMNGTKAE